MPESKVSSLIRTNVKIYPDFPKQGVKFVDIFPLFTNPTVGAELATTVASLAQGVCVVPEARGFLFAGSFNLAGFPVVVLRKKGKLPYNHDDVLSIIYKREYGIDNLCYRKSDLIDAYKALKSKNQLSMFEGEEHLPVTIFDDVLATGGTAKAIADALLLLELPFHIKIRKYIFLIEIKELGGANALRFHAPVTSLCKI